MDDRTPGSDRLRRLASRYEADLSHGRAEQLAARAIARARRAPSRPRRLAAAAVGTSLFVVAFTGLGFASESAVPGDLLYPIDRAIESIGLDGAHLEERLEEAIVLADRGDRARVFEVANEVLDEVTRTGVTVRRGSPADETVLAVEPIVETGEAADDTQGSPESAVAPSSAVVTPVEEAEVDPIKVIRLQAENLLRTVRTATEDPEAAGDVEAAAASLAQAVDAAATEDTTTTTSSTTSTTTTSSTTTSTTSTTTTTEPGSSTTSTTVPEDGGEDDGSEPGDGDGSGGGEEQPPITLPQP